MVDTTAPVDPELAQAMDESDVSRARVEAVVYAPATDVVRNHLVTLAYVDLSEAMAGLLGRDDANWCTLAIWPSYTVGQSIRAGRYSGYKRMAAMLPLPSAAKRWLSESADRDRPHAKGIVNRSLAAGNRGVFYEVGLAWVDFIETFGENPRRPGAWNDFDAFGARVMSLPPPPGRVWPDGVRERLRDGLGDYLRALQTDDPELRAQLILRGNLQIGEHEQRRLQGWLEQAANAPIQGVKRFLLRLPAGDRLAAGMERGWHRVLTTRVYFVQMGDERIDLGRHVPPHRGANGRLFPPPLDHLHPDVAQTFERIDRASPGHDGADQWTDIDNRMSFIATLFRARQRAGLVGKHPFTPPEVDTIKRRAVEAATPTGEDDALLFADVTERMATPWSPDVDHRFLASLVAARTLGDEPADAAVESYFNRRPPHARERRYYTHVMQAAVRADDRSSGPIAGFLAEQQELPLWADPELIARGQAFYRTFRSAAHLGLFYGAMPLSYAASKGCQVLGLLSTLNPSADRSTGETVRRFWESTRFVEDVFTSRFWEQGSDGYASIRGVRLFHAAVRHTIEVESVHIAHRPVELGGDLWNTEEWGRPVNQEDLLAGTLDWAVATIHVMDRFGVPLDEADAEAYLHTWLVVGALLGVDEDLLTSPADPSRALNLAEAQYGAQVMLHRQLGPTVAGRRLMDALLALIDEWFPGPTRLLPRAMLHAALNEEIAHALGLPPPGRVDRAFKTMTGWGRRWRRNRVYAATARRVVRLVGEAWLRWWEKEYGEVPPYRRGGHAAVKVRIPVTVTLSFDTAGVGSTQALKDLLAQVDGAEVSAVGDDGGSVDDEVMAFEFDGDATVAEPAIAFDTEIEEPAMAEAAMEEPAMAEAAMEEPAMAEAVEAGGSAAIDVSTDDAESLREVLRRMRDGVIDIDGVSFASMTIVREDTGEEEQLDIRSLSDAQIDALVAALVGA